MKAREHEEEMIADVVPSPPWQIDVKIDAPFSLLFSFCIIAFLLHLALTPYKDREGAKK